jgi:hypothetical protein
MTVSPGRPAEEERFRFTPCAKQGCRPAIVAITSSANLSVFDGPACICIFLVFKLTPNCPVIATAGTSTLDFLLNQSASPNTPQAIERLFSIS